MTEERSRQPGTDAEQSRTVVGPVTTLTGDEPEPEYELQDPQSMDDYRAELEGRIAAAKSPRKGAREGMLIRTYDRTPVRVLLPDPLGWRDLENGIAFIDGEDPAYDNMKAWAEANLSVEIVGVKAGSLVCSVCGEHVEGGPDGLALHTFEFHVDSGESEETGKPPSSAARARAEERRKERVAKATRE